MNKILNGSFFTQLSRPEQVLIILGVAIFPVAYLAPKALIILEIITGLVSIVLVGKDGFQGSSRSYLRVVGPLLLLALYAVVSAIWALEPQHSLMRGLRLVVEFLIGGGIVYSFSRLKPSIGLGYLTAIVVGGGLAFVLVGVNILVFSVDIKWSVYFSRGSVLAALLVPALILVLLKRRSYAIASIFLVIVGISLSFLAPSSAKLSLIVSVGIGAIVMLVPRIRYLLVPCLLIAMIIFPFLFPVSPTGDLMCRALNFKSSAAHRLHIWNFSKARMDEKPILGWGMDTSRIMPGGQEQFKVVPCPDFETGELIKIESDQGYLPLHTHSFIMQIWLELGAVGAVLAAVAFGWMGFSAMRHIKNRWSAAAVSASMVGAFVPASLSFGIWQGWWLASLFLVAGIVWMAAKRLDDLEEDNDG